LDEEGRRHRAKPFLDRFGKLGPHGSKKYKTGVFVDRNGNKIRYRSSYEERALQILDADDNVVSIRAEAVAIPFVGSDGKNHLHYPDFIVYRKSGCVRVIEVKPESMRTSPYIRSREWGGAEFCSSIGWTYEVWTENEIGLSSRFGRLSTRLSKEK
jgi:hypothetical protein